MKILYKEKKFTMLISIRTIKYIISLTLHKNFQIQIIIISCGTEGLDIYDVSNGRA